MPPGAAVTTETDAVTVAEAIGVPDLVVKAQVLAGGRGKGHFEPSGLKGGVQLCRGAEQVREVAASMIGQRIITKQTGELGRPVSKVFVSRRYFVRREAYFSIVLDRQSCGPVLIGSPAGGMDIEAVAEQTPELIFKLALQPGEQPAREDLEELATNMGFAVEDGTRDQVVSQMLALYRMFDDLDATLIEVNPLAETNTGEILCLDGKATFDDNAAFRHEELHAMRDWTQEDEREVRASRDGLNYIGLDGSIGCIVNGAGLAMATMDIIKLYGGEPSNFCDLGGGATKEQVEAALSLLNDDPKVEAILVNIFGGIMRCDVIALGIIGAAKGVGLKKPVVVRLQGTKSEEGDRLLEESGLPFVTAKNLDKAARQAVKIADIMKLSKEADLNVDFSLPL